MWEKKGWRLWSQSRTFIIMSGTKGLSETALAKGKLSWNWETLQFLHLSMHQEEKEETCQNQKDCFVAQKNGKFLNTVSTQSSWQKSIMAHQGSARAAGILLYSPKKAKMGSNKRRTGKSQLQYFYCPSTVWVRAPLSSVSLCIVCMSSWVLEFWFHIFLV